MRRDRPGERPDEQPGRSHEARVQFQSVTPRDSGMPQEANARSRRTTTLTVGVTVSRRPGTAAEHSWYDAVTGKLLYWGLLLATLLAVWLSATGVEIRVPAVVYLFGFLGAAVSVFTSFADQFNEAGHYCLSILSRTVAVLPLAAGLYLLAFAFPAIGGEPIALDPSGGQGVVSASDRIVAGIVFLAGVHVSATLRALGGVAERLVVVGPGQTETGADTPPSEDGRAGTD